MGRSWFWKTATFLSRSVRTPSPYPICSALASSNSRGPQEHGAFPTRTTGMWSPEDVSSQVITFFLARLFVLATRFLHALALGYLRNRDVPPGVVTRHANFAVGLHHDYRRALRRFCLNESFFQFRQSVGFYGVRSQAPRVGHVIHG